MTHIVIRKVNETFIRVECDTSTLYELNDKFSFYIKNHKYHPLVKKKIWDGKIRCINLITRLAYAGLILHILNFAKTRNYTVEYDKSFGDINIDISEIQKFSETLGLPFAARDYQIASVHHFVKKSRGVILSPTGSGKSLIAYMTMRWYNLPILIIVPSIQLVGQMAEDFAEYGYKEEIKQIMSGVDKTIKNVCTISTWQSLHRLPKEWFDQFGVVIVDEVHGAKAKSLTTIMEKLSDCKYRFGLTGTLDNIESHQMTIEGLFGPTKRFIKTIDLMDRKELASINIKAIVLKYEESVRETNKNNDYHKEMDFIVRHKSRNKFIKNLTLSLKGNTLVMFHFVDKHGRELYAEIEAAAKGRKVFFVWGGVEADDRNEIRRIVEIENDAVIVASDGTFSAGVNIKNLHNIILASPRKDKITTLQAIGRGLRTSKTKQELTLYDIVDDLTIKGRKPNFAAGYFKERQKLYNDEGFIHKIYYVDIKG